MDNKQIAVYESRKDANGKHVLISSYDNEEWSQEKQNLFCELAHDNVLRAMSNGDNTYECNVYVYPVGTKKPYLGNKYKVVMKHEMGGEIEDADFNVEIIDNKLKITPFGNLLVAQLSIMRNLRLNGYIVSDGSAFNDEAKAAEYVKDNLRNRITFVGEIDENTKVRAINSIAQKVMQAALEQLSPADVAYQQGGETPKGLSCQIFRSDFKDPYSFYKDVSRVLLVDSRVGTSATANEGEVPVVIKTKDVFGKTYTYAEPNIKGNWAFGASYIYTPDSRINGIQDYPIPLHDRDMSQEKREDGGAIDVLEAPAAVSGKLPISYDEFVALMPELERYYAEDAEGTVYKPYFDRMASKTYYTKNGRKSNHKIGVSSAYSHYLFQKYGLHVDADVIREEIKHSKNRFRFEDGGSVDYSGRLNYEDYLKDKERGSAYLLYQKDKNPTEGLRYKINSGFNVDAIYFNDYKLPATFLNNDFSARVGELLGSAAHYKQFPENEASLLKSFKRWANEDFIHDKDNFYHRITRRDPKVMFKLTDKQLKELLDAIYDLKSVKDITYEVNRQLYEQGGQTPSLTKNQVIAGEIMKQLGGTGRLRAMIGIKDIYAVDNGVSFKMPNAKANYVKITLNSKDLYDVEIGRIRGDKYTVVAQASDYYNDMLKPFIEEKTGLYLSLADGGSIKAAEDLLMEAGGKLPKVIGETTSGKPVYDEQWSNSELYSAFTAQDHRDASDIYMSTEKSNMSMNKRDEYSAYHWRMAEQLDKKDNKENGGAVDRNIIDRISKETPTNSIHELIQAHNQILHFRESIMPRYPEMENWERKEYQQVYDENVETFNRLAEHISDNSSLFEEELSKYNLSVSEFIAMLKLSIKPKIEMLYLGNGNLPLSTQLRKLTGDSWNVMDFESNNEDGWLTTEAPFRHKKTGRIFQVAN